MEVRVWIATLDGDFGLDFGVEVAEGVAVEHVINPLILRYIGPFCGPN